MFTGTVKIEICQAVGLRATDKQRKFWQDEPILDPYVQLDIDENHLDRSSTKLKTFDPVWNECFIHEVQDAVMLGFTVFHDAALPPDYFVANCSIPFEELVSRNDKPADLWVGLSKTAASLHILLFSFAEFLRQTYKVTRFLFIFSLSLHHAYFNT